METVEPAPFPKDRFLQTLEDVTEDMKGCSSFEEALVVWAARVGSEFGRPTVEPQVWRSGFAKIKRLMRNLGMPVLEVSQDASVTYDVRHSAYQIEVMHVRARVLELAFGDEWVDVKPSSSSRSAETGASSSVQPAGAGADVGTQTAGAGADVETQKRRPRRGHHRGPRKPAKTPTQIPDA